LKGTERVVSGGNDWVLVLGSWLVVVQRARKVAGGSSVESTQRIVKDRHLVFTSACSGARKDPPKLRRLIVPRRWLDSARLSLVPGSTRCEDHTRWTGPRQVLVFSSSFPSELEALIKTTLGPFLWVCACVCLWCQSAK